MCFEFTDILNLEIDMNEINAKGEWLIFQGKNHRIDGNKTLCGMKVAEGEAKTVSVTYYGRSMGINGLWCKACQDKIVEVHCGQAATSGSKRHAS